MSVKVAIRVRPFNERQKFLGCVCCIQMKDNTTVLYQNKQKNKKQHYFTFDHSFWSHDEFTLRHDGYMMPTTNKYIDQQRVYNVIGKQILENAWNGYNCCLFAYGQTGAGKSYSMIGYGANRGIIPMVCEEIFHKIKKYQQKGEKQYEITLSMLEIYNEKVQDLFVPTAKRPQNGLKIRQNKTLGVYVEGLTKHEVFSYTDIERRMDQGSKNRSLASTLMNEYSSRAHTIVMLQFVQKEWINKLKMNKKSSFINLVDLAGSQRVSKTGISDNKDRLKEASNINKSLHTLGRVIEVLAELAAGKGKNLQVPYRDSALTRILETALGGNSKTTMICAISPANDNYEQSLSTLRYADQTKKIKNKPIVNESAVDKIIRELREQNERLKRMLQTPQDKDLYNSRDLTSQKEKKELKSNLRASMREVQKEIRKNLKSFAINTEIEQQEESLMMTQFVDLEEPSQFFSELSFDLGNKAQVYITNLNEDEQLNYKVRYSCQKDLLITNKNNKKVAKGMEEYAKIVLCGLGIEQNHAKIIHKDDRYFIEALSQTSAEYTLVNGKPVYERKQLQNNDRIIMGINSVFIFKNENKKTESKDKGIDYEFVMNERQKEMENLSLIPPSSLNLFLATNFIKDNKTRDIYAGPPTQALNATKKLFGQENQAEIFNKITEIQGQFDKLVRQNEQKMKEKQQYYRQKLTQLKRQKEKQKQQKTKIEEKLMIKSLQSQTLKSKNSQLQNLKQKLSKYVDEKNRRAKVKESMLLQSEDTRNNAIQEDIIGEFVDLEDPNQKNNAKKGKDLVMAAHFDKKKKAKRSNVVQTYEEVTVEEFEDSQDIFRTVINPRESTDSLLLADQNYQTDNLSKTSKTKKVTKVANQREAISESFLKAEQKRQKALVFQFRRLYNIKILSEMQQEMVCNDCSTNLLETNEESANDSFISKYVPQTNFSDAELEEFHYKNAGEKKKKAKISEQDLLLLEQHILQLQNKLLLKQQKQRLYVGEKYDDSLLLNFSMENSMAENTEPFLKEQKRNRQSFSIRKFSKDEEEITFTLSQQPHFNKVKQNDWKVQVSEFIQILSQIPQLKFSKQEEVKYVPVAKKKKVLKMQKSYQQCYVQKSQQKVMQIESYKNLDLKIYPSLISQRQRIDEQDENLLLSESICAVQQQKVIRSQMGINTEAIQQQEINEKAKGSSFTAFLNEQLEQTHQNQTQLINQTEQKEKIIKQCMEVATNTQHYEQQQPKQIKQTNDFGVGSEIQLAEVEMVTDINMHTYTDNDNNEDEKQIENYIQQQEQKQSEDQIQNYLASQKKVEDKAIGTEVIETIKTDSQSNTIAVGQHSFLMNTSKLPLLIENQVVDIAIASQKESKVDQDQVQNYLAQKEEDQIANYLQNKESPQQQTASNNLRKLEIVNNQVEMHIIEEQDSPIKQLKKAEAGQKVITQFKLQKVGKFQLAHQNIQVSFVPEQLKDTNKMADSEYVEENIDNPQRNRAEMIDQEVQVDQKFSRNASLGDDSAEDGKRNQNSQNTMEKAKHKDRVKEMGNSQQLADKFNLSVSDIEKHELSYQQMSVFGFDGLLKEDQLNSKIKLLQDKIKELESQSSLKENHVKGDAKQIQTGKGKSTEQVVLQTQQNAELKRELELITKKDEETEIKGSKYVPLKRNKKKKKKTQMTEEQRKEHQIQKELQAKIIQCNNQNIINQRNLQIHKRKREAEELRKILIKKEKVELQKQLLVLIPMVRRFNLIAREMKRLIEGKISIEYRNFSHYEMVQILKSYSISKKVSAENIQIRIVILNCQEGRIYTWPVDVFKNRYEISEQTFEKYLEIDDEKEVYRNRMLEDRSEKSKDPFWDPVDFIPQGVGYLSMQSLLYGLSYEGYISIVYKSAIIAKLFVNLTPLRIKKQTQDEQQNENEQSQLDHIEIYNQRNLLEKEIYFTISIQSIKFMKNEERQKLDQSNNLINLNSLNSNILKYSISYQLLQNDYKLITFDTPEVDFIEDKQFKRIDYMRRHSFKNVSEATLAYISDCPIKFTLNVMKDYNEECLNASFTQDFSEADPTELDSSHNSGYSETNSIRPKKNSVVSEKETPKDPNPTQPSKSDFSKKPSIIYENTQIITKLQTEAKNEQERRSNIKKMQQNKAKLAKYQKQKQKDKDKDKDCTIY